MGESLAPFGLGAFMGVSETRGPEYSTLNSRILIIRTPKEGTPNFRKLPFRVYGILEGAGDLASRL